MVLALELTSTRLYAYIGSAHATSAALSIAMLGLGLGGFVRLRVPSSARRAAIALPISLLCLALAVIAGAPMVVLVAVSLVPFTLAGMLVADAYAERGNANARATYAIDLFAAAMACLVAPRLLGPLSPTQIIALLGVLCCAIERRLVVGAIAVAHLGVLVFAHYLPDGPLAVLLRSDATEKAIVEASRDVVDSEWSPLGRLDVQRTSEDRLGVYTDGMSPTFMVRADDTTFESTWGLLMSLPYRALRPKQVLVLGAGAGASVWLAKKYGATRVDAVEVNPAIPDLLARWKQFAGDVYSEPGVRLVVADARRYLSDTAERYDVIELALALTGNVHAQPSGMEAHLYTVEAVRLYLRRLTPTGALVLIHSDPGNAYRQLLTVIEALGGDRALEGIVVLRDPRPGTAYRYMLVVRASPMPLEIVDGFDVEPAELLWGPGDSADRRTQLLDRTQLGATHDDDLSPVYDERPYFFQNTKGLVATALAEPGRLWILAGALVFVVALVIERVRDERFTAPKPFVRTAATAAGLGAAFLCVELALIQRFTLAAGGTLYAVSFVLFGLLAWSAAGALLLGRVWRRRVRGVTWACLAAAIAIAATALFDIVWLESIESELARLLAITAILAPIGLAIGCPFPTLLVQHGEARVASLWAINGVAAVAGGIVAVLALRAGGSTDALVLAAGLYLTTALIAPTTRP